MTDVAENDALPVLGPDPDAWLVVTVIAFVVAGIVMIVLSVGAGWGALRMGVVISPVVNLLIAVVSGGIWWARSGRFSARVLTPFGLATLAIILVFLGATTVGGGGGC